MLVNPTVFLAAVSGLIRIGKAARDRYLDHLLSTDLTVLLPPKFPQTGERLEQAAIDYIRSERRDLLEPGAELEGIFRFVDADEVLAPGTEELTAKATVTYLRALRTPPVILPAALGGHALSPVAVLTHREWAGEKSRARRARLGIELANFAIDIIATQPDMLGMGRRATAVVGGLVPSLKVLVEDTVVNGDSDVSIGERLVQTFVRSSLETVAERPELFVSDQKWAPLVAGLVVPLKEHVQDNQGLEMFALDRLEKVLRGPIAHSVLTALSSNADTQLTGRFGKDDVLGAVTRTVLGALVSTQQDEFDLMEVFSSDGASMLYTSALDIAQQRPELFIDGAGVEHVAQRQFLSKMGGVLKNAPRPYKWDSGLAPQLSIAALEVASAYASTRIRDGADDSLWASAGVEVADRIFGGITAGFTAALQGTSTSPFERLFHREQAVDIIRVIALQVARTPKMITGDGANPEVKNIAAGIARAFAEDTEGLLDGEDWRLIVSKAMGLAATNPGALFDIDANGSPERQVAVLAIGSVMRQAALNLGGGRREGAILFGETLREAVLATVEAASSRLLTAAGPGAEAGSEERLTSHLTALEQFIAELLDLSAGDDPAYRMSASEWLYVYRSFVAHVLANGPAAFSAEVLDDDDSPLRITRVRILAALESRSPDDRSERSIA